MAQRSKPPDRPPAALSVFQASPPVDRLAMLLTERRQQTLEPEQRGRTKSVDRQITRHALRTAHFSEAEHAALPDTPLLIASDRAMTELMAERLPADERADYLAVTKLANPTPEQQLRLRQVVDKYGRTVNEGKLRRRIREIMREAKPASDRLDKLLAERRHTTPEQVRRLTELVEKHGKTLNDYKLRRLINDVMREPTPVLAKGNPQPDSLPAASVLDDFLDALRRKAVSIHQTKPPQCLAGFMGTPTPYEIVGPVNLVECERGLGLGGFGAAQFSPAALWQEYGDVLPEDHILLVFSSAVSSFEASGLPVALEVRKTPKGVDFTSFVKASDGRWYVSAHGIRVADSSAFPLAFCDTVVGPFRDPEGTVVHVTQLVLFHMLKLMRHQAVEYQMGVAGAGQRRFNVKMARGQSPIPRPRVLDLSTTKIERIPLVQPRKPSEPTGVKQRPHDQPPRMRRLSHPKYGENVGKLIPVRGWTVHGGATEPPKTVVKLPEAAQPASQDQPASERR